MTEKELTISNLKKLKSYHNGSYGADINRAIKLLEQESCEDAISRQAVKERMIKYGFHAPDMTVTEFVKDLPPVKPQEPFKPMVEIDLYSVIKQRYIERDILDKIRAEINKQEKWLLQAGYAACNVDIALDAIKSVVAESEVQDADNY